MRRFAARWIGSKSRVSRAGLAPAVHGCSTLRVRPLANRWRKCRTPVVAPRRVQIPPLQRASQSQDARALNSRTSRDHAVTFARFRSEIAWSQTTVPNSTASLDGMRYLSPSRFDGLKKESLKCCFARSRLADYWLSL